MSWNLKIGAIVPSWNSVMEYEFQQMAGPSISVHSQRIRHTADTEENVAWLTTQAPAAAELLSHAKVDALCYGCTASGFLKTPQEDLEVAASLERQTGIPSVTSSACVLQALRAFKVRRLCVASPYEPWLNEKLRIHLEAAGFQILAMRGLGTQAHSTVSKEDVHALALDVWRPEAESIFISCSNFRTLEIIETVEKETRVPVVTSNQAALWGTLRRIGNGTVVPGAGRLFHEP